MDVAAFVLSILALLFAMLGLGLSMRALYIIGVNSGLAKPQENKEALGSSDKSGECYPCSGEA